MMAVVGQAQSVSSEVNVTPPWGAFPAEQYLIRHWDFNSPSTAAEQRRSLISAYLELDTIPKDWDATGRNLQVTEIARTPTQREVEEILAPWRPIRWREAALHLWRDRWDEEVWLRTSYDQNSDEKFAQARYISEDYDPAFEEDCRVWTVLDDPALFDDDWSAALYVLPELTGPTNDSDAYSNRHLGDPEELERLRGELRESVRSALRLVGYGNVEEQLRVDAVEAGPAGTNLQAYAVATFLIVVDAEAFDTEKARMLFLDRRGNIVRESRVPFTETWEMRDGFSAQKFRDWGVWNDRNRSEWGVPNDPGSILGEKYAYEGEIGLELYRLD